MKPILDLNAFDASEAGGLGADLERIVQRRRKAFGAASVLFYAKPLQFVRGEDCWLYTEDGTAYLDAYNNVPSVGLHGHARRWTLPQGFCRKRWDVEDMVGLQAHWGPWRAAMGLSEPGAQSIERALARIRSRLDRFGRAAQRFGLVHADMRLANLLVDGTQLRIIDFDDCGFSWFLYDFAAAISFIEHETFVPELLAAWLVGYRSVASIAVEEAAEIPTLVVLRRILLTAWLASHSELSFAQSLGANFTAGTVKLAQEFVDGRFHGRRCDV